MVIYKRNVLEGSFGNVKVHMFLGIALDFVEQWHVYSVLWLLCIFSFPFLCLWMISHVGWCNTSVLPLWSGFSPKKGDIDLKRPPFLNKSFITENLKLILAQNVPSTRGKLHVSWLQLYIKLNEAASDKKWDTWWPSSTDTPLVVFPCTSDVLSSYRHKLWNNISKTNLLGKPSPLCLLISKSVI